MRIIMHSIKLFLLKILPVMLFVYFLAQSDVIYDTFTNGSNNLDTTDSPAVDRSLPDSKPDVQFAIIACRAGDSDSAVASFRRHLAQLEVLFKSAAVLTSTIITFNVVTNSEEVYNQIINIPTEWPTKYSQRLRFGPMRNVYYPPDLQYLNNVHKLCAAERLFMVDVFEDSDAVIFIDTDTYFMQPPENLWAEFKNFEDRQVIGLTPHLNHYNAPFDEFPVFGFSGMNAGVLLMNITRIKTFPIGWHTSIKDILDKYTLAKLKYIDQDILNILFGGENAAYAYEVGCEWNYAVHTCHGVRQLCPGAASKGVALLHVKGSEIQGVYGAWDKYDLRSPVEELMLLMHEGLKQHPLTKCRKISNINDILLKGLMRHLNSTL